RLVEAPAEPAVEATSRQDSEGTGGAPGGKPAPPEAEAKNGDALKAAEGGTEGEEPPPGITVGGAGATAGGSAPPPAAEGTATTGAGKGSPGGGGGINAPCYKVDPPPRPENTPEPSTDAESGESRAE